MPRPEGIVLVVLQFSTIALMLSSFAWIDFGDNLAMRIIGSLLIATGLGSVTAGVISFHQHNTEPLHVTPDVPPTTNLVTTGIWSMVRHPLYFGVLQIMLGVVGWHQGWPVLVMWAGLVVILAVKARFEESLLIAQFPEEYPRYRAATCMLLPIPCCRYSRPPDSDAAPPSAVDDSSATAAAHTSPLQQS